MPSPSDPSLILPAGLTEAEVLAWAREYAPLVLFDRSETHFPADAHDFMRTARFRESLPLKRDFGWNRAEAQWIRGDARTPEYFDAGWEAIGAESRSRLPGDGPFRPWASRNARPWDSDNARGPEHQRTVWGLFLERDQRLDFVNSGRGPTSGRITAPVFVDVTHRPATRSVRVLYWFYYDLNQWKWFLTHEGDWEHISLIVPEDGLASLEPPTAVYLAQHNTGDVRPFSSLTRFEAGHRVVYVDRDGHPTHAEVRHPEQYSIEWHTWECPLRLIVKEAWRDYSGAWGAVGTQSTFTGPLGPLFRRHRDLVRVTRRGGRLYVRSHRK